MLALMFEARAKRIRRLKPAGKDEARPSRELRRVPPQELFRRTTALTFRGRPVLMGGSGGIVPEVVEMKRVN